MFGSGRLECRCEPSRLHVATICNSLLVHDSPYGIAPVDRRVTRIAFQFCVGNQTESHRWCYWFFVNAWQSFVSQTDNH